MKINLDSPPEEIQIQIIPLIDVIFCILTFFILAALQITRQQAINIDLPQAKTGTAPQARPMLVVTVSSTGQIFVDKQPVIDRNQLYQTLQDYRQKSPDGLFVLNASKVAFYNDVVQILDLMRSVGGDRVALSTQPAEVNQPSGLTPIPTTTPFNPFGNPNPSSTFNPGTLNLTPFPASPGLSNPGINPGINPGSNPGRSGTTTVPSPASGGPLLNP